MSLKWLRYQIASVNWLMREAGSKSADNYRIVTTVKNTSIKRRQKYAFTVFEEVLRQFFKRSQHIYSSHRSRVTKCGLAIPYGFGWIRCQAPSGEPSLK